jgi:hypothetical protein
MVDPPVCVPRARGTWKSATAAPEPEDEPPGVRIEFGGRECGLIVLGPIVTEANSVVVVFPFLPISHTRTELAAQVRVG